jgi:glutaredoxin
MRLTLSVLCSASLLSTPVLAADLYKWEDSSGNVHYSDSPPPKEAKTSQRFQAKGNVIEVDKQSYATRYAVANQPVTLFVSTCGPICDQARELLLQRGIPYLTKDPSKEPEIALELKKLTGKIEVPVIKVGNQHQMGFEASSWNSLLDAAGYPRTPLPNNAAPAPAAAKAP